MKKTKLDYNHILFFLMGLTNLFFIVLLILLFSEFLPDFWKDNLVYFFFCVVVINTLYLTSEINIIPEEKRDKSSIVFFAKYLFLLLLIVIAANQFLKRQIIIDFMPHITAITIAAGFLAFYAHKNRVEKELEDEKTKEEDAEKKRASEFNKKFPRIAKFNWGYGFDNAKQEKFWLKRWLLYLVCVIFMPIIWVIRLPYNLIKWMHKEGWKTIFWLLVIYIIFAIIQIYKIYTTGIGTDEGNFLYTVKLLFEGKKLFLDFWSRESGSLLFLIPWFKIFKISIINLRWLVFIFNLATISILYLFIKEFGHTKKRLFLIFGISIILLQFNGPLDIWHGFFYHLFYLNFILLCYFSYKIYLNKSGFFIYLLMGLLMGVSVLIYKPLLLFLIVFSLEIYEKTKVKLYKAFYYFFAFVVAFIAPLIFYWIYYALPTDFYHIYRVVLIDIFQNSLVILFTILLLLIFSINKKLRSWLDLKKILTFSYVFILFAFFYRLSQDYSAFLQDFYLGTILQFTFLILLIQTLNFMAIKKKTAIIFLMITFIFNVLAFIFSFGKEGEITFIQLTNPEHLIYSLPFIFYLFYLITFVKQLKNQTFLLEPKHYWIIFITNISLSVFLFIGELYPTRFHYVSILFPILLSIFLTAFKKIDFSVLLIMILSAMLTLLANLSLPNNYNLYNLNDFNQALSFLNNSTLQNETVFSADTAILAEIKLQNIILFSSSTYLRFGVPVEESEGISLYSYPELYSKYDYQDISMNKSRVFMLLKNSPPSYIIGGRATFNLFFNQQWAEFLKDNYELVNNFGRINIFKLDKPFAD